MAYLARFLNVVFKLIIIKLIVGDDESERGDEKGNDWMDFKFD